jgi:two-component system LytT family response regulator
MRILLIEDETLVAISLAKLVRELEPGAEIEGPLASVRESLQWLASHPAPDLILSDIQLADGISLDIFTQVHPSCPIIFTTAYDEYAIRAFKVNSIDYLLKPIDKNELAASFQKFHLIQSKFANEIYIRQLAELFGNFNHTKTYKDRFAVNLGRSVTWAGLEDIVRFIKEDLVFLVNREGKRFITDYRSLDEVEELVNPHLFFRVSRQFLVHLPYISSYRSEDTGRLAVRLRTQTPETISVSKEKASQFRKWFDP